MSRHNLRYHPYPTSQEPKASLSQDDESEEAFEPWGLDNPFKYAPPKPDGDPWSVLLEPLLRKDKMRCDAWKDEVQNLLIFAGLFSAVVTTFIIESYKSLQANPNDSILKNSALTFKSILAPIFSNPIIYPYDRINTFWFISLVLSLTTVLFGIISLQWLREHQSYPDLSSKQIFAVFHMRNEGLQKWHVPGIFTAIPLLLQAALALFLGGLIDFLLAFGDKVAIPFTALIGIVLLFLVATTILPTVQGFLLYLPFPSRTPMRLPSQCPYKSPQSRAFRIVSRFGFKICSRLYPHLRSLMLQTGYYFKKRLFKSVVLTLEDDHLTQYISDTWRQKTWTLFDLGWLAIRDAYMRDVYGRATETDRLGQNGDQNLPIFDITQGILAGLRNHSGDSESSFSAEYHCLIDVSESIPGTNFDLRSESHHYQLQEKYFHDLLAQQRNENLYLTAFFDFDETFGYSHWMPGSEGREAHAKQTLKALQHENIFMIVNHIHENLPSSIQLSMHKLELQLRLLRHFYTESYTLRRSARHVPDHPTCLSIDRLGYILRNCANDEEFHGLYLQFAHILLGFFKHVGSDLGPSAFIGTFHAHRHLPRSMENAAYVAFLASNISASPANGVAHTIRDRFTAISAYITDTLNADLSSASRSKHHHPSLLFYAASLYLQPFLHDFVSTDLLFTMSRYKERTIDAGVVNRELEEGLMVVALNSYLFSRDWWKFLDFPWRSPRLHSDSFEDLSEPALAS